MLLDPNEKFYLAGGIFGGNTPEKQITTNLFVSLGTCLTSVVLIGFLLGYYAAHYERTLEPTPGIIYFVYVFLGLIAFWQFFSFIVGLRLKSKFGQRNAPAQEPGRLPESQPENAFTTASTQPLLTEADTARQVNQTITEETTRNLKKVPRR